ncbi:hypothetical protein [Prochlorococcus sp. MIT 1306]|uniref:hypothetical protein n=1 Tax=Prochlorococcus sp. MIT 1306 TaxID=1799667 RepID=UPI0007B362C8|nr:hypothetical protein [Prochlorococcus sp. MIT 1306]
MTKKTGKFLDGSTSRHGNDVQKRLAQAPNSLLGSLNMADLLPTVKTDVALTVRNYFKGDFLYSRGHLSISEVIQFI